VKNTKLVITLYFLKSNFKFSRNIFVCLLLAGRREQNDYERGTGGVAIVAVLADWGMEGSVHLLHHQKTLFFFSK
jgi:hypothetical protein